MHLVFSLGTRCFLPGTASTAKRVPLPTFKDSPPTARVCTAPPWPRNSGRDARTSGVSRFRAGTQFLSVHRLTSVQGAHKPTGAPASLPARDSHRGKHLPARMPALPDEDRFMGSVHGRSSVHNAHEPRVLPADCKSALRGRFMGRSSISSVVRPCLPAPNPIVKIPFPTPKGASPGCWCWTSPGQGAGPPVSGPDGGLAAFFISLTHVMA
jgi:hypothetical protein